MKSRKWAFLAAFCFTACFHVKSVIAKPPITNLTFSADGSNLVACSQAGVDVLQWPSLKKAATYKPEFPNLNGAAFSPSGSHLAVSGGWPADEGRVEILSWPELKIVKTLGRHTDSVMDLVWLDNNRLAAASLDHEVTIWNTVTGKTVHVLKGHSRGVTALTHIQSENILVSAGIDQSLRVWNSESGKLIHSLSIHTQPVHDLALRPKQDGLPMVASASDDRSVRFWQPTIGRMVRFARLKSKPMAVAWTPDGTQIVAGCTDGKIHIVNPETVQVIQTKPATNGWINCIVVHPKTNETVVGGAAQQIVKTKP